MRRTLQICHQLKDPLVRTPEEAIHVAENLSVDTLSLVPLQVTKAQNQHKIDSILKIVWMH